MKSKFGSLLYHIRRNLWRVNIRAWFDSIDHVEIDRPIFLLGTQGGGLTLVSRILRRNPTLVSVTGGYKYWNGADEMQNVMASSLPESLQLQGRKELEKFRSHGGWTYACNELFRKFRESKDSVTKEDAKKFKHAIRIIISMYGSEKRDNRFIDKSQSYSLKVSYINEILKDSNPHFLVITRNPYAMCQRAVTKTNLSKVNKSLEEKIKMSVQHWGNTMRSIFEDKKKVHNLSCFKIEDILSLKSSEIIKICDFLDIDFEERMMPSENDEMPLSGLKDNKWHPIRKEINKKYLKKINPKIVYNINKNYEKEVIKSGYKKMNV